jgi:hypothetical protein
VSTNVENLTVPEKILLAADHLDKQGHSPFSAEALTVTAWQKFSKTFGLKGYTEHHPDSNKILTSIMGEKGLVRRGWLVKMGQKLYALTRDGRLVVRRVMLEEEDAPPENANIHAAVKIARPQERFLLDLLESSAFQKFDENRKADLTFADASRFWGITENMKGDIIDDRLHEVGQQLLEVDQTLDDGNAVLSNGREITAGDIRALANIHRYMADRFDRHLSLLRTRAVRT